MPKSEFIFGTFNSASYSWCHKLKPINFPTPEKDTVSYEVPGRSGDLLVDFGSYKNVDLECEAIIEAGSGETFLSCYDKLRAAIMIQNGYQRLEDSLYAGEYRMARAVGIERSKSDTQTGTVVIKFDAKPQRYLTAGEVPVIQINSDGVRTWNLTYGLADEIFNNDMLAYMREHGQRTDILYGIVHHTDYMSSWADNDRYEIRGYYTDWLLALNNGYIYHMKCQGSPLVGGTMVDCFGYLTYQSPQPFKIKLNSYGDYYTVFQLPYNGYMYDTQTHTTLSEINPLIQTAAITEKVVGYEPLIHITVSSAVSVVGAVIANGLSVNLNTPASIDGDPIEDIYIDLETYNVYTIINGTTISLNSYVSLGGEFITYNSVITVTSTDDVDAVELIPRWWSI